MLLMLLILLILLIPLIEKERVPSMSILKIIFTLDPLKAIRKTSRYFVANFSLDLKAKKKIIKQK